jgi:DNA-directed RNA polymerase subunit beta
LDKEHEKEVMQILKRCLIDKLIAIVKDQTCQGVYNYFKEEQIKKGTKFTAKSLSTIDYSVENAEGWTKDNQLNTLVKRCVHNFNMQIQRSSW